MKLIVAVLFCLAILSNSSIYDQYYQEAYRIVTAMSLEQKVGQTIQGDMAALNTKGVIDPSLALKYSLGSVLVSGDDIPDANGNIVVVPDKEDQIIAAYLNSTLPNWKALSAKFNDIGNQITTGEGKTYKIKLLLGTDAVHGNQHVVGSVIFPHNLGLSCSHNEQNFQNVGYWTGQGVKKSGFNYAFAPTVAVSHNPQWGRYYETMGQEDDWIRKYSRSFVKGLQNIDGQGKWDGVLGSAKHFMADGATMYGADQGDALAYSFKNFIKHNVQGYVGGIDSEVGSVMCSYSAVNGVPMAINALIQNVLRKNLNFGGFVISDYDQLNNIPEQQLPTSYVNMTDYQAYASMLNAGIDMFMVPSALGIRGISQIFANVRIGIQNDSFDLSRLDDAATRIVTVKLAMGVIQQTKNRNILTEDVQMADIPVVNSKATSQHEDSLTAVRESLVLLKNNNNVLPLKNLRSDIKYVVLVGERIINVNHLSKNELFRDFDNIGVQCGGWTIRWQGFEGSDFWAAANKAATNASSILDGLQSLQGKFQIIYPNYTSLTNSLKISEQRTKFLNELKNTRKDMHQNNTVIIGVIAESPYAETAGDVGIPYCKSLIFGGDGCRYDGSNPYLPEAQRKNLDLDYDSFSVKVIDEVLGQDKNIPLVTVMLAGRPMLIKNAINMSSAFIAGWLPGTSGGQGIIDAISGDYVMRSKGSSDKRNTLSVDWPSTEASLQEFPVYPPTGQVPRIENALFEVGHGLSTA